jgi:hypothetical protein
MFFVRYVRRMFTDEVLRDMVGSSEVVAEIEREWEQLIRDRNCLRQIFPNGNSKVNKFFTSLKIKWFRNHLIYTGNELQ